MGHRLQQFTSERAGAIASKLKSSSASRPRVAIARAEPRALVCHRLEIRRNNRLRKICSFNAGET